MRYVEERELVVRLHLRAEFPDDYDGEGDGYEWYRAFDGKVRPELLREIVRVLAGQHGYRVTPLNRGMDTHEEIELRVDCAPAASR
jgi:hypothetical protein